MKAANDMRDSDNTQKVNELKENGKVRPMTRRQKHKAEKIKKKYGDQDDEERELRLMLLASRPKDAGNSESLFTTFLTSRKSFFSQYYAKAIF